MKTWILVFLIIVLLIVTGCVSQPVVPEKPIGKGFLDLCISDPTNAGYWQRAGVDLWDTPLENENERSRSVVEWFPSCSNTTVTIWEKNGYGADEWYRVTLRTNDGRSNTGWLPASHILLTSNETGTEWSENYSALVGTWDQTQRGNGARIWYEFNTDGTFTFNYDMMGNRDNMQDKGSWTYLGNNTWNLVSNVSADHGHTYISLDQEGKSFKSGFIYSSRVNLTRRVDSPDSGTAYSFDPAGTRELVYHQV